MTDLSDRPSMPARLPGSAVTVFALVALLALPAAAQARPALSPSLTAPAGLLVDMGTGRVVYAKNPEEGRAPASLVKLMTLFLAYEDLGSGKVRLDDQVLIGPNVERTGRYRMGLRAGQVVPFEILLAGVAIASANDAATAIAERLGGTEQAFVERMNAVAAEMGLEHTHFANPHGLPDPSQRTTAHDLARLAQHLLTEYPDSSQVLGQTEFSWRGRLYQRRIPLFRDPGGVDALKTGFTLEAGYNLAVSAGKAGSRYLCIILGADTRRLSFTDAGRLLKFGFGEPVTEIRRPARRWRAHVGTAAARPMPRPPVRRVAR